MQRSVNLTSDGLVLSATCLRGKRRQQVAQLPFEWGAPAYVAPSVCIADGVLLEYGELKSAAAKPTFLILDVAVPPSGRLEPGSPKLAKPMPLARFSDLLKSLLQAVGVSPEETAEVTSYSLRRFMPTLADCQAAPYEVRLAIGNWVEAVDEKLLAQRASDSRMPIRYAEEKAKSAGMAKFRALVASHEV